MKVERTRATHKLDVGSHLGNLLDLDHDQLVHLLYETHTTGSVLSL